MIWSDKGSEFISNHFKEFLSRLESKGIKLCHTDWGKEENQVLVRDGIRQ